MAVRNAPSPEECAKLPRTGRREQEDGLAEPHHAFLLYESGIAILFDSATDRRFRAGSKEKPCYLNRGALVATRDVIRDDFEHPAPLCRRERSEPLADQTGTHPFPA